MDKVGTKKRVMIVTAIGVMLLLFGIFSEEVRLCQANDYLCSKRFDEIAQMLLIFLPTLFFSLITYKMRAGVFNAWRNFAIVWVPASIFLVAISPSSSAPFQIIDKEFVAIVFSLFFSFISLILIAYKSFSLRKRG